MKGIEAVKVFREKFGPPNAKLLEKVRNDNKAIAALKRAMKTGAKTVPQLAKETTLAGEEVLWYMNALKKYGEVDITGNSEGFKLYALKGVGNV